MFKSAVFRSAVQHALVFGGMALLLFVVAYFTVANHLLQSLKADIKDTANELKIVLQTSGYEALIIEVNHEVLTHGSEGFYTRVLDTNLMPRFERKPQSWTNDVPLFIEKPTQLKEQWFGLSGDKAENGNDFMIYSLPILDQGWIQVGQSLTIHKRILNDVIMVFGWTLLGTIILGMLSGIWQVRSILKGVTLVRQTAIDIGKGTLGKRVSLGNHGQELDDLASAFNTMLDRVDSLLEDVRNVSNHVAHDLRSPIVRMRGLAETAVMAKHKSVQEADQTLGMIVEECDYLSGIIDTMLEIAQADSGLAQMPMTKLDLNVLVKDVYEFFLPMAEQRNISLTLQMHEAQAEISGDKMKLQRVLANVLDNAIKFTPDSGSIRIHLEPLKHTWCVSVADTGEGIAQDDIPHVCKRFYRAEKSRTSKGNGLGLSYVESMMKAHGGEIEIESEIEQGTVIRLTFPAA